MDNLIKKMHDGELEQKILDTYPDIKELLNEFQSAQFELEKLNATQEFTDGFKVGAKLMMEILNSTE